MILFFVAIGGALGSVARFLFSEIVTRSFSVQSQITSFPWGTFFVNLVGSLMAGVLYFFVIKHFESFDVRLKNFLLAGFLGGFTTFSAFSLDFFRLASAGHYSQAATYALASVLLSILALFFGFYSMKLIFS